MKQCDKSVQGTINCIILGLMLWTIIICAIVVTWKSAKAANDPPQVGDTSHLLLVRTVSGLTWTVTFKNNNAASSATYTMTDNGDGTYDLAVTWPSAGDWLVTAAPAGSNQITTRFSVSVVQPGSSLSATDIDNELTAAHGTGLWNAAGDITILPFQGAASYETVVQNRDVHVTSGDSVSIPYSIGKDLTGWTLWFGVKASPSDTVYAVPLREVTSFMTAPATGSGLINLSVTDTDIAPRRYEAELQARNGDQVNTVLKFNLWIDPVIIR